MPRALTRVVALATGLAAAGLGLAGLSAAPAKAATALPAITSVTVPAQTFDVTTAGATVTVQVHVTAPAPGLTGETPVHLNATFGPDAASTGYAAPGYYQDPSMTLVSGTVTDGVWQSAMYLPPGDWGSWNLSFDLFDQLGNEVSYSTAQLAAKGFAHAVKVVTTKAPTAPTGIKTQDVFGDANPVCGIFCLQFTGDISWTQPAGGGAPGIAIDKHGSACGSSIQGSFSANGATGFISSAPRGLGICDVTFEVENGFASTGKKSVSYF